MSLDPQTSPPFASWPDGTVLVRILSLEGLRSTFRKMGRSSNCRRVQRCWARSTYWYALCRDNRVPVVLSLEKQSKSPLDLEVSRVYLSATHANKPVVWKSPHTAKLIWYFDRLLGIDFSARALWRLGIPLALPASDIAQYAREWTPDSARLKSFWKPDDYSLRLLTKLPLYLHSLDSGRSFYLLMRQGDTEAWPRIYLEEDQGYIRASFDAGVSENEPGSWTFVVGEGVSAPTPIEALVELQAVTNESHWEDLMNRVVEKGEGTIELDIEAYLLLDTDPPPIWPIKQLFEWTSALTNPRASLNLTRTHPR